MTPWAATLTVAVPLAAALASLLVPSAARRSRALFAAGAMLTPGKRLPAGELWAGRPARFARKLTNEEVAGFPVTVENYRGRGQEYLRARREGG